MVIDMNETNLSSIAQLRAFLEGTAEVQFQGAGEDTKRYGFISAVLKRFGYARLCRADKGVVLRYLARACGYSRAQLRRLVRRVLQGEPLRKRYRAPAQGFARRFGELEVALLAATDVLHGTLSGPATKKIMQRAYAVFGDPRYEQLATISVAHLYNLRKQRGYQDRRRHWTKTKGFSVPVGERRAPAPDGRPGFIRIDSVHQGDQDGVKGVYHINAVDCVTQWQLVATCERLSEACLLPVLQALLEGFPFVILGFHADNGSEYINHTVAKLLEKLRIEFTKSRPRHSNDNALVETKNGAIVRKHLGYTHIPQRFAAEVNAFLSEFLNPYVNFHRPCFFPETYTDAKGKSRKRYRFETMMTPYEKLKSLPKPTPFLKPTITFKQLDTLATTMSDNDAAHRLNQARTRLFQSIHRRSKHAA
ncbi:MAG: transposase family protein [Acidobacteria bacterium]|nr:transposase family protein [Acidobacteriota bacterium]